MDWRGRDVWVREVALVGRGRVQWKCSQVVCTASVLCVGSTRRGLGDATSWGFTATLGQDLLSQFTHVEALGVDQVYLALSLPVNQRAMEIVQCWASN